MGTSWGHIEDILRTPRSKSRSKFVFKIELSNDNKMITENAKTPDTRGFVLSFCYQVIIKKTSSIPVGGARNNPRDTDVLGFLCFLRSKSRSKFILQFYKVELLKAFQPLRELPYL